MKILLLAATLATATATASTTTPNNALSLFREDSGVRNVVEGNESDHALLPIQTTESSGVRTEKFQHYYKGLEVVGAWAFRHTGRNGEKHRQSLSPINVSTVPNLTAEQASRIALNLGQDGLLKAKPVLKIRPEPGTEQARLVYYVQVSGARFADNRTVIIDAHSGEVYANLMDREELFGENDMDLLAARRPPTAHPSPVPSSDPVHGPTSGGSISHIAPIEIRSAKGLAVYTDHGRIPPGGKTACQLVDDGFDTTKGAPVLINASACKLELSTTGLSSIVPTSADETVNNAARNSLAVLNYYASHHQRNSFDDRGSKVVSVIHAGDLFDNAFWSQDDKIMAYGDGDPSKGFGDFSSALDVAGHEMTHGVTAFTAQLEAQDEAGALNEANSDFFGKMIADDGTWVMGKKIFLDQASAKGIRDLANPESLTFKLKDRNGNPIGERAYPAKYADKVKATGTCDGSNDNCWVHANSTIVSHAAYLVATAIGKDKAEKLYYFTLAHLMHPTETFQQMSKDVQEGCSQLNFDSSTCAAVKAAYTKVGL